jgi:exodeoxyribonuclease VII large subunit
LITDEQVQAYGLLQRKATQGYKEVDGFIKSRIIKGETIKVVILVGRNAIIDSDIKHQLKEAITFYNFSFNKINLNSEQEIIGALKALEGQTDILVISSGGGDNMEVFNRVSLAEKKLSLNCHLLTAIGHKEDVPLLQKVADKAFITSTAIGQYLNDMYIMIQ